jgi:hypothetical protein
MQEDNQLLMKQMQELMTQFTALKEKAASSTESVNKDSVSSDNYYKEINPMKPIKVISLSDGGVSLRTSTDGNGTSFRFNKFGQAKYIPYQELQNVISTDRNFIEDGVVYICDEEVVRNNYLEEAYSTFLTKNTIENILTFDIADITEMVSGTTQSIQETIVGLLVSKINNNEFVDMNKVSAIGKACKGDYDILSIAMQKKK